MLLQKVIKKIPLYNKEELLFYIIENSIQVVLKITTNSGNTFRGYLLNIYKETNEGSILLIQLIEEKKLTNDVLHLSLKKVECIVFSNSDDIIKLLSKGEITKPKSYTSSNKLEVKRKFKNFSEVILEKTGVDIGVLSMELPSNTRELNRIFQITEQIQKTLVLLLKQEDAKESWKSKFTEINFINNTSLKIESKNTALNIHFMFTNLDLPEISEEELNLLLLSNL